jgi:hypothetical protein
MVVTNGVIATMQKLTIAAAVKIQSRTAARVRPKTAPSNATIIAVGKSSDESFPSPVSAPVTSQMSNAHVAPKHAMSSDCHSMSLAEEGTWRGLTASFDGGALNGDGAGAGACMSDQDIAATNRRHQKFFSTQVTFAAGVEKPRH